VKQVRFRSPSAPCFPLLTNHRVDTEAAVKQAGYRYLNDPLLLVLTGYADRDVVRGCDLVKTQKNNKKQKQKRQNMTRARARGCVSSQARVALEGPAPSRNRMAWVP